MREWCVSPPSPLPIANLQQEVNNLCAQLHTLQTLIQAIPAAPVVQPPPPAPAPSPPRLEVAKPADYDGKPATLDSFIHQCQLHFAAAPAATPYDDRGKVAFALSYMNKDSALVWAEQKLVEYSFEDLQAQPPVRAWTITWAAFLTELRATFGDMDRAQQARLKLPTIVQGNRTADEFNFKFMSVFPLTGFNDHAGLELWKKGLKPSILRRIFGEATLPADFAAWRARAAYYELVDCELRATITPLAPRPAHSSHRGRTIANSPSSPPPSTQRTPKPSSSTPSSSRSTPAPVKVKTERVEPVLAAQRMKDKLCIRCGLAGHFADKCLNPINHGPILTVPDHCGLPTGRGAHAHHQKRKRINTVVMEEVPKDSSGSN